MAHHDQLDEMVRLVAAEHGIVLDRTDPSAIIPTLVKFGIEQGVRQVTEDQEARRAELRRFMQDARQEAAKALEKEMAAAVERIRSELKLDLDRAGASAATLVANVQHANTRPVRVYWMTMGLIAAGVLLAIGFGFGVAFERYPR